MSVADAIISEESEIPFVAEVDPFDVDELPLEDEPFSFAADKLSFG